MLDVRLYDNLKKMIEIEGVNKEVLRNFFNEMVEKENFDLSFYQ